MALWLNRRDIPRCVNEGRLIQSIKRGFQLTYTGSSEPQRIRADLSRVHRAPEDAEAMILVPGAVAEIPAYTVKVHAKYPSNPTMGLPAIQGIIQLFDSATGQLLAILDSPLITAHRTAAACAVAVDVLARKEASTLAIVGAGSQGEMQLRYLRQVRNVRSVVVYDTRESIAMEFANRRMHDGIECKVASSVAEAVQGADIVITATWAKEPFIFPNMIRKGVHITTLGPDSPGKVEVSAEVIQMSSFVCDHIQMARSMGALNTFRADLPLPSLSTLTDVLNGTVCVRQSPEDITVFGTVGLPFQDLVCAWDIYHTAMELGVGQSLDDPK